jgi:hypothetical protein
MKSSRFAKFIHQGVNENLIDIKSAASFSQGVFLMKYLTKLPLKNNRELYLAVGNVLDKNQITKQYDPHAAKLKRAMKLKVTTRILNTPIGYMTRSQSPTNTNCRQKGKRVKAEVFSFEHIEKTTRTALVNRTSRILSRQAKMTNPVQEKVFSLEDSIVGIPPYYSSFICFLEDNDIDSETVRIFGIINDGNEASSI